MQKSDYCADCWQRRIDSNQGSRKFGVGLQILAWLTLAGLIVWTFVSNGGPALALADSVLTDRDWPFFVGIGLAFGLWALLLKIGKWLSLGYGIFDRLPGEEVPDPMVAQPGKEPLVIPIRTVRKFERDAVDRQREILRLCPLCRDCDRPVHIGPAPS